MKAAAVMMTSMMFGNTLTPTATGTYNIECFSEGGGEGGEEGGFYGSLAVFSGSCGSLSELTEGCTELYDGGMLENLSLTGGQTYYIRVASPSDGQSNFVLIASGGGAT